MAETDSRYDPAHRLLCRSSQYLGTAAGLSGRDPAYGHQSHRKLQMVPTASGNQLENVVGAVSPIPVLTMSTYLGQIKSEALMNRIIKDLNLPYNAAQLSGMIESRSQNSDLIG